MCGRINDKLFFFSTEPNLCRVHFPLSDWQLNILVTRGAGLSIGHSFSRMTFCCYTSLRIKCQTTPMWYLVPKVIWGRVTVAVTCFNQFTFVFNAALQFRNNSYQSTWYESQTQTSVFGHILPIETTKYLVLEIRIPSGLFGSALHSAAFRPDWLRDTAAYLCLKKKIKGNHLLLKSLYYYHPLRATCLGFDLTFVFNKYFFFIQTGFSEVFVLWLRHRFSYRILFLKSCNKGS